MFVEYRQAKVGTLLSGREAKEKGRIPSVEEYDRKIRWLHDVAAYQGCPFAAEWMYEAECNLFELREFVVSEHEKQIVFNRDSYLQLEENAPTRVHVGGLSNMGILLVNTICVYGELIKEFYIGEKSCTVTRKETDIIRRRIEKSICKTKSRPFGYVNRSISGVEDRGSMEWELSVRDLKEPRVERYDPKYFIVKSKKPRDEKNVVNG